MVGNHETFLVKPSSSTLCGLVHPKVWDHPIMITNHTLYDTPLRMYNDEKANYGKRNKHIATCQSHGLYFIPFGFSTSGSFHPKGEEVLSFICQRYT